jgi:hypothetical protein
MFMRPQRLTPYATYREAAYLLCNVCPSYKWAANALQLSNSTSPRKGFIMTQTLNLTNAAKNYNAKAVKVLKAGVLMASIAIVLQPGERTEKQQEQARKRLGTQFLKEADKSQLVSIRKVADYCNTVEQSLANLTKVAGTCIDEDDTIDAACIDAVTNSKLKQLTKLTAEVRDILAKRKPASIAA